RRRRPLLPYTTLFRSVREPRAEAAHRERGANDHGVAEVFGRRDGRLDRVHDDGAGRLAATALDDVLELLAVLALLDRGDARADEDRKSTRLNSSHVKI